MDCWDGSNGEPIIYHGHTLTSKIFFKDVLECVNQYAFVASTYPVILSLEVHCSPEQQVKMAQYLIDVFGDKLVRGTKGVSSEKLPSPNELKHKIVVKGPLGKTKSAANIEDKNKKEKKKHIAVAPELAELILLGGKKHDFEHSWQMISLSEGKIATKLKEDYLKLVQ